MPHFPFSVVLLANTDEIFGNRVVIWIDFNILIKKKNKSSPKILLLYPIISRSERYFPALVNQPEPFINHA